MKTAISTCIKNEQAYLDEWINHHLDLGFDHIYLYEDFGSKPHNSITDKYNKVTLLPMKVVMNEENHIEGRQMKSVKHSLRTLKEYDWVAFIDADEFIILEEGLTLDSFLNRYENYDGIYLSWRMFGACGHVKKPNGSVRESYPTPELKVDFTQILGKHWLHKSFYNMKRNPKAKNIHSVANGINLDGGAEGKIGIYHTAWIDHYFTKSWEEWCDRIFKRGDLCNGNRRLHLFFKCNPDFNDRKDKMISAVADMIPHGGKNYWLTNKIIAGGNVRRIKEINEKLRNATINK